MKILNLPHLPNKVDVTFAKYAKPFAIIPPNCFMQIRTMSKDALKSKLPPPDFKTIFGVVRQPNIDLVKNFINENGSSVVNLIDKQGFTPVHWAALEGTCEIVNYLLELDADYDNGLNNERAQKPIHWAALRGKIDIVTILLNKGVDINSLDSRGYTPVCVAVQYGHLPLVAFLVSKGAKLDIPDSNGDTCLHWAAYRKHPDLTRLLIIYGVYPKTIDNFGQTVLHLACLGGNLNIVQQLVESDFIDPEIRDKNGKRAVEIARAAQHSEIVDYLERHEKFRKKVRCNWKTFLFGPVENSKYVVFFLFVSHFCYAYPVYISKVVPMLWDSHFEMNVVFLISTFIMWVTFYFVHTMDPGYLPQNTEEYRIQLKRLTFKANQFSKEDLEKNFSRLCHSCKTIKPLRASHCKQCNRCVLAFDHHCPYVQNCVGYKNRVPFFIFVFSFTIIEWITTYMAYMILKEEPYLYWLWPGAALLVIYCCMVSFLLFGAVTGAIANLTTNELVKKKKKQLSYDYLTLSTRYDGSPTSIFDRGLCYNIQSYFHCIEPSPLETENQGSYDYYEV